VLNPSFIFDSKFCGTCSLVHRFINTITYFPACARASSPCLEFIFFARPRRGDRKQIRSFAPAGAHPYAIPYPGACAPGCSLAAPPGLWGSQQPSFATEANQFLSRNAIPGPGGAEDPSRGQARSAQPPETYGREQAPRGRQKISLNCGISR